MKHGGKLLLVCVLGGSIALSSRAAEPTTDTPQSDSPYQPIIERNVFSLKPPPPPPSPEDNKPPPPKITLTGITTVLGKRALMKTPAPPVKAGTPPGTPPPTEQFYMLSEGEKEGGIEVVAIDEKAGSVKVLNGGQEYTLTFEKDGLKVPTTPMSAGMAPGTLPGTGVPGQPPIMPAGFNPATGAKPNEFPVRPMRVPGLPGSVTPTTTSSGAALSPGGINPAGSPTTVSLPSFNTPTPQPIAQAVPDNFMSHEEQIIALEAQRQITQRQVQAGRLPPLPPTIMTPPGSPGSLPTETPQQSQTPGGNQIINLPPFPGRNFPPPPPLPR